MTHGLRHLAFADGVGVESHSRLQIHLQDGAVGPRVGLALVHQSSDLLEHADFALVRLPAAVDDGDGHHDLAVRVQVDVPADGCALAARHLHDEDCHRMYGLRVHADE
mmetsp:Transcript_14801/g.28663  ORF Transcript_14801/g.28663 Transcript_14801/m.28663 type:complete len:108 (-) Transcript_14801:3487-3810(-)